MPITPEKQKAFEMRLMQEFASQVEDVLRAKLRQRAGKVPSETVRVLRMQAIQAASALEGTQAYLSFQDSGRIVDMKGISFSGRRITKDEDFIHEWVKKKGADAFAYVPGYPGEKRKNLSKEKAERRISNGIIASGDDRVRKSRNSNRDRIWFSRTFYSQVNILIENLIDKQADLVLKTNTDDIREAFDTK